MPGERKRLIVRMGWGVLGLWVLASALSHRIPHKVSDRSSAPILPGAEIAYTVSKVFNHACVDCHSEKTTWPWYSNLLPASWFVEADVQRARSLLNLSRWDGLDIAQQRALLTAIATVIENHEMPPPRYVMMHAQAALTPDEAVLVIEWTRTERRRLRASLPVLEVR
jgi:hypothetical protein